MGRKLGSRRVSGILIIFRKNNKEVKSHAAHQRTVGDGANDMETAKAFNEERPTAVKQAIKNLSFFNTEAAKKAAAIPNAPIRILPEEIRSIDTLIDYIAFLEQEAAAAKEELEKTKEHPETAKAIHACGFVIGENGDEYSVNLVARKILARSAKDGEGIRKEKSQGPEGEPCDGGASLNPGSTAASQGLDPTKGNEEQTKDLTKKGAIKMEKRAITEKEAIAILTRDIQTLEGQRDGEMEEGEEYLEALIFAVHAIAEVRQYRKIGTIKECRELACIVSMVERNSLAKVISEWLAYRKLGSIEELQAIVGRQGPMQETEGHGSVSPDTQA